jgi:hypothetical protein
LITKVWERLHIGGLEDGERLNSDNPAHITTVVSLCPEPLPQAQGIAYVRIPITDAQPISAEKFEKIMKTLTEQISSGTVLLVCAAGMSRSPIIAAALEVFWTNVGVADAANVLLSIGSALRSAKELRNDNNYESLLIAHEYRHTELTRLFNVHQYAF